MNNNEKRGYRCRHSFDYGFQRRLEAVGNSCGGCDVFQRVGHFQRVKVGRSVRIVRGG